ncbi:MAG: hypothetical protein RRY79_01260 [Clostridia bacterium]
MKLSMKFRIVLYLLLLVVVASCIFLFLCDIGATQFDTISDKINVGTLDNTSKQVLFCIALMILLLISISLFIGSFQKNNEDNPRDSILVHEEEDGSKTEITLEAVTAIVYRHCMSYRLIAACTPRVRPCDQGEGMTVKLKLRPIADTELPALTEKLRISLRQAVSDQVGLTVKEIPIIYTSAVDKKTTKDNN